MAENRTDNESRGFNFTSDVFGGQFLSRMRLTKQWVFLLYIFILIIIYISINLEVANKQVVQRRNQRELKNLKSDYTSKMARLQNQSKQGEVELRLAKSGSKVQKPKAPARLVEQPE